MPGPIREPRTGESAVFGVAWYGCGGIRGRRVPVPDHGPAGPSDFGADSRRGARYDDRMFSVSAAGIRRILMFVGLFLAWSGSTTSHGAAPVPTAGFGGSLRQQNSARVVTVDPADAEQLRLETRWEFENTLCRFRLRNPTRQAIRVREVVLFDFDHGLPATTPVYGEGFQMLSQTVGTLGAPKDLGGYTDRGHYRLPEPAGFRTVYGLLMLAPEAGPRTLLGFTTCRRFSGKIHFNAEQLQVVVDTEGVELKPNEVWDLEELLVIQGTDRERLLDTLATRIGHQHTRLKVDPVPVGWCSWYCFGPGVTATNITDNLDWIATNLPALRYIQIDDGYQPWMGDWLDTGKAFGGGVQDVLARIRARGFEPAIWVAPFVASEQSRLFREHPDWMVKDDQGKPLRSDRVGFGGWRLGPWYVLDGTHPEAQRWLENTFRTMRREWGCTYFKLDATYWGTLPEGHRHDARATRIEAYRRGMEAIRRGAGNAVILGCNHPIWPSFGLIHASRSSLDIDRSWGSFASIGRENLMRGWQNGRLWWNDPDCVLFSDSETKDVVDPGGRPTTTGKLPDAEFQFHATLMYATGGMILSGDDLTKITPRRLAMLRALLPPSGRCARFENEDFETGVMDYKDRQVFTLLNWGDQPARRVMKLAERSRLKDLLTGEDLGIHDGDFVVDALAPRSGRLLEARPEH